MVQESYEKLDSAEDKRQVLMVQDTLKLGGAVLSKIPDMLAAQARTLSHLIFVLTSRCRWWADSYPRCGGPHTWPSSSRSVTC